MKRLVLLLLLPALAGAGEFVTNPATTLPGPKTDSRNLPAGSDPNKFLRSSDYNALRDAANDLRDYVRAPNDAQVTSTGGTTARSLRDWMRRSGVDAIRTWDTEPTPYIAGRSGIVNPENTPYSWDPAVAVGAILEMDVWRTADDALVVHHDTTTTRTTGVTLTVSSAKLEDLRTLNAAANFNATHFPKTPIPTLEEVVVKYGRRVPMIIEIKGDARAATLAAQLVKLYGLQDGVVISSFGQLQSDAVHAVDSTIRTMMLSDGSGGFPTVPTLQSRGVWGVGLSIAAGITTEQVATYHAAGFKVFGWSIDYVYEAELELAKGLDGVYTDSSPYFKTLINASTLSGTTIAPPANVFGTGWRLYKSLDPTNPGAIVSSSYATFDYASAPVAGNVFLIFPGLRTPDGTYTITTTVKLQKASATTANVLGARIGFASDHDVSYLGRPASEGVPSNGYYFKYGADGSVGISRVTGQAPTGIASATWATLAEGAIVPLRIDVTPTTITVTRTDNSQTITATDATHPRRGFFSVFGSGQVPAVGATTITY